MPNKFKAGTAEASLVVDKPTHILVKMTLDDAAAIYELLGPTTERVGRSKRIVNHAESVITASAGD